MVTINTADDLIDVLRSDDRVRSAVRRELLTEEVLALPAQFGKMVVPGLGPHCVVGELVPVQVELAADEIHDGRRHELPGSQ